MWGCFLSVTGSASVNFGAQAMANVLPSSPPPLIQAPPKTSLEASPFTLTFITGNIRVCRGCRQKFLFITLSTGLEHNHWAGQKEYGGQLVCGQVGGTTESPDIYLCVLFLCEKM